MKMKFGITVEVPEQTLDRQMVITLSIKIILKQFLTVVETRHHKLYMTIKALF